MRTSERGARRLGVMALALGLLAVTGVGVAVLTGTLPPAPPGRTAAEDLPPLTVRDVVLGVGGDEAQRNVAWYSIDARARCVQYSSASGDDAFREDVTTVEAYASGDAVPAGFTWFHATMGGLEPSARYAYRFGDCETTWSTPFEFATHDDGSFGFLLFGDPQLRVATADADPGRGWADTARQAVQRFPGTDFMMTTGDNIDSPTDTAQTIEWELFLAPPELSQYALAPTIGNHDEADGAGTQYGQHFALPNLSETRATVAGSGDYWFTYNEALFMNLDSNNPDVAEHERFMTKVLAAHPEAAWTVVALHHAPYGSSFHSADPGIVALRGTLSPILSELGIDLVISGHEHSYARSYLMNGTVPVASSGGPTVTPRDGEVLYIAANSASGGKFYDVTGDQPWIAVTNQERVANYSNIRVEDSAITITTYRTSDGSVVDRVVLMRNRSS